MRTSHTILIVEDEPAIAELIELNLRSNGYQTRRAADGHSAQQAVQDSLPDLVLLDWMLPGISGMELLPLWRQDPRTKHMPVILLTARAAENDRVSGLDGGADDYITKPFSLRELLARVQAMLRRHPPPIPQTILELGPLQLDVSTHRAQYRNTPIRLGPTEFRLLHHLMQHAERVHSRQQLLDKLWGADTSVEERTVDVHIKRLREALGPAASLIETVRGVGYRATASPL